MPQINLVTNVELERDEIRPFILEFNKCCSEAIGKPENFISIDFRYNPDLTSRGTFDPAVRLLVVSLGNTTPENAQVWAAAFSKFFEDKLKVPPERALMIFNDPGAEFVGVMGTTVAALSRS